MRVTKRANEILRSLRSNDSGYPILNIQEIDSHFLQNDSESSLPREASAPNL